MKVRRLLPYAVLAILLVAGVAYWYQHHRSAQRPEARYQFQEATRGDLAQSVSANGTLNPVTMVNVGTQVSGTVKKLDADFNDRVQKDQVLLELDPSLLMAQVRQSEASVRNAMASLELAQANEKRNRLLFAQ